MNSRAAHCRVQYGLFWTASAAVLIAFAACKPSREHRLGFAVSGNSFPRSIELPDERKLTLERRPDRIVSLSVGTDEILCALVAQNNIERIAALCHHSAEPDISNVADIARRLGVLVERDAERIVSLRPDLVLAARYTKVELREIIDQAHIPLLIVNDFRTIGDIEKNIRLIGRATGEDERANDIVQSMHSKLSEARSRLKAERALLRALYLTPGNGTAGADTNVNEIITSAGLRNAAAEAGFTGHSRIAVEKILEINPDLILVATGHERDRGFAEQLGNDAQLAGLAAVKQARIVRLPSRYLRTVSHHIGDALLVLVDAVNRLN